MKKFFMFNNFYNNCTDCIEEVGSPPFPAAYVTVSDAGAFELTLIETSLLILDAVPSYGM